MYIIYSSWPAFRIYWLRGDWHASIGDRFINDSTLHMGFKVCTYDMRYEFSNSDWRFSKKKRKKEKNNCHSEHVYLL